MHVENLMKGLCLKLLMPPWKFWEEKNRTAHSFLIYIHQIGISLRSSRWIHVRVFKYFELESLLLKISDITKQCWYLFFNTGHINWVYIKGGGGGVNVSDVHIWIKVFSFSLRMSIKENFWCSFLGMLKFCTEKIQTILKTTYSFDFYIYRSPRQWN